MHFMLHLTKGCFSRRGQNYLAEGVSLLEVDISIDNAPVEELICYCWSSIQCIEGSSVLYVPFWSIWTGNVMITWSQSDRRRNRQFSAWRTPFFASSFPKNGSTSSTRLPSLDRSQTTTSCVVMAGYTPTAGTTLGSWCRRFRVNSGNTYMESE